MGVTCALHNVFCKLTSTFLSLPFPFFCSKAAARALPMLIRNRNHLALVTLFNTSEYMAFRSQPSVANACRHHCLLYAFVFYSTTLTTGHRCLLLPIGHYGSLLRPWYSLFLLNSSHLMGAYKHHTVLPSLPCLLLTPIDPYRRLPSSRYSPPSLH